MTSTPYPGADDDADRLTVLTFSVGERRYCVPVEAVASAVGVSDTDALESAPDPWNAGTVRVEDTPVRVVDLPRVFTPPGRTVVREDGAAVLVLTERVDANTHYGWLVDDVDVTRTVSVGALDPARSSGRAIRGRLDLDDGDATVLDVSAMCE